MCFAYPSLAAGKRKIDECRIGSEVALGQSNLVPSAVKAAHLTLSHRYPMLLFCHNPDCPHRQPSSSASSLWSEPYTNPPSRGIACERLTAVWTRPRRTVRHCRQGSSDAFHGRSLRDLRWFCPSQAVRRLLYRCTSSSQPQPSCRL